MIVRFGLLQKKSGMTQEEFSRFWLTKHGPLARRMPGLRAYSQNHIVDTRQLGIKHQRGAWQFDGFSGRADAPRHHERPRARVGA